jgi:DinB family protein
MDDTADRVMDRETALARFDHARDDFLQTFAAVPDEALSYLPKGDDYTIGDLLPHLIDFMHTYTVALDAMRESDFGETRPYDEAVDAAVREHDRRMKEIYSGGEGRPQVIEQLEQVHDRLAGKLRELAYEDYSREAPVYYRGSTDPYPTRAADFLDWLTDHYYEHVAQVNKMLGEWKQQKRRK